MDERIEASDDHSWKVIGSEIKALEVRKNTIKAEQGTSG